MDIDFHYYATYCAASLAGYSPEEAETIAYSAQFVDKCTRTYLAMIGGPLEAATTQLSLEMVEERADRAASPDITRIWASFHFLPYDLYAEKEGHSKHYLDKYRLICGPNGKLLPEIVNLAKGSTLQATGIAMHVLADTWAHRYFAGTPSVVINNTDSHMMELIPDGKGGFTERRIRFGHNPAEPEDPEKGTYTATILQINERSIMNLGHGRCGHLPDYAFIRYRYLPAWGAEEVLKENPRDYYLAFTQMVEALRYLRGEIDSFGIEQYDSKRTEPYETKIREILEIRQCISVPEWRSLGEEISGKALPDFDVKRYAEEYLKADKKEETFLGRFFDAALSHKSLVINRIAESGNPLAGGPVDYSDPESQRISDDQRLTRVTGKLLTIADYIEDERNDL